MSSKNHECLHEADLAVMKTQLDTLYHRLNGNGEDGILERLEETHTAVIKMDNYNNIKNWVLGGSIAFLTAVIGFLFSYVLSLKGITP